MNTEDKAKELVEKFLQASEEIEDTRGNWVKPWIDKELAKGCAKIVVDELLKETNYPPTSDYWKEVKNQIEKL